MAVEDIRNHLQSMYNSLRDVVQVLDYEEIKKAATEDVSLQNTSVKTLIALLVFLVLSSNRPFFFLVKASCGDIFISQRR